MPTEIVLTSEVLRAFSAHLRRAEKSPATVEKYARGARMLAAWLGGPLTREAALAWKETLTAGHTAAGANGLLAALNSLVEFLSRPEMKVKLFRVQRRIFAARERELTRSDLDRLLQAADRLGKARLRLVMQTLFATGIRVSELRFITVGAVARGRAEIRLKGKTRTILIPTQLCRLLSQYAGAHGVNSGPVFVTRGGRPLDRSNIWTEMKHLCTRAGVAPDKVFPHNLRRLFARVYYRRTPNLAELADLMGHSNVNTTRIYTASTGAEFRRRLDALGLVT
jgi:integrase